MNSLSVLVFAEYGWRNGGENSWLAVAEVLRKRGFEFKIACPAKTELSNHLNDIGMKTIDWQLARASGTRKTQDEIRADISEIIRRCEPDIVHANSLSSSRLVGPVTQQLKTPALGYLRDIIKISRKAMSDINGLDSIVAVSAATRNFHIDNGLSAEKSTVIHNGVDLEHFKPAKKSASIHHELGLKPGTRLVLCIGQIGMRKGTHIVIQAFNNLCRTFNDVALLLVGMRNSVKDEAIEYEQQCRQLDNSNDHVFWLGRRNDASQLMNSADVLLHGARQEPLGRVLLESLASGLPFVATDVGGTREIIVEPSLQDQVLVDIDCVDAMTNKSAAILGDATLQKQIAADFRNRAIQQFNIERCADELLEAYNRILVARS